MQSYGLESKDLKEIARRMAAMPKQNSSKERIVIITQGNQSYSGLHRI